MASPSYRLSLLVILLLAFALRLVALGAWPPGLYHDEAYYGLDAAGVLAGNLHVYFPANNGREPLFIYLVAGAIAVLGQTPAAIRLVTCFGGVVLVAATYAAGAGLFNRRVGLLAAALTAVAPWAVLLSRVGFRAGTLPLVLALAIAATARGVRSEERRWVLAGGALAGLTLYTYTAARLVPLLALAFAAWATAIGWRPQRRLVTAWAGMALLVALPLLVHFARSPGDIAARVEQVGLWSAPGDGGRAVEALLANGRGVAAMVMWRGDFIPRHNIPFRPVLGPLGAALWLVGLVVAVARSRRSPAAAFLLLWTLILALPTLLAENAPHFLRAVGLLPAIMITAGLGACALAGRPSSSVLARRRREQGRVAWARIWVGFVWIVATLAVAAELRATVAHARSVPAPPAAAPGRSPARSTDLYYPFEAAATDLAREVNAVLGTGWQGGWAVAEEATGWNASPILLNPRSKIQDPRSTPVWLDRRLRDGWAAVPYLVPPERVTLVDPHDPIFTSGPGVAFLQPFDLELEELWAERAPDLRLAFRDGPMERGDLEAEARPLYVRIDATAAPTGTAAVARFANGMVLAKQAPPTMMDGRLILETEWGVTGAVTTEVTASFQVLEGDRVIAAGDEPLGSGLFGTSRWRPGDRVVERRVLDVPGGFDPTRQRLIAGLYVPPSVERIPVVDATGRPLADHVELAP